MVWLLKKPHLVAHKFYFKVQPAAYFCIYKKVRERALENNWTFDDKMYGDLPGPRMTRGQSVQEWFDENAS
ncbi:unnamed protein product [Gongylonema pulchrum]|uniref:Transposase n=1 Tax=Gongylonema pulchrum TaxID=637853 RepID=A0A183DJ34_9BILA|nr:unnamed protein product [Gongylonema pulchrum]